MKSSKFDETYKRIAENITTTSAGVGATQPTTDKSGDFYAPEDSRVPKVLGKNKKLKVYRRPFPKSL